MSICTRSFALSLSSQTNSLLSTSYIKDLYLLIITGCLLGNILQFWSYTSDFYLSISFFECPKAQNTISVSWSFEVALPYSQSSWSSLDLGTRAPQLYNFQHCSNPWCASQRHSLALIRSNTEQALVTAAPWHVWRVTPALHWSSVVITRSDSGPEWVREPLSSSTQHFAGYCSLAFESLFH